MTALALAVVGEFSKVQEMIDESVRTYVWQKAPSLRDFLSDQGFFDRIPDAQRPRFVLALANELKTHADMSKFRDVFHRVKEVRDQLAHAVSTELIDENTVRATKGFMVGPLTKKGKEPTAVTFTRQQLTARLHDARWLLQHMFFMWHVWHGPIEFDLAGERAAYVQPPADPADWDGTLAASLG
jgi:hypothetical protein